MVDKLKSFLVFAILLLYVSQTLKAHPRFAAQNPSEIPNAIISDKTNEDVRGVVVQHVGNFSVSFVPLVTLIINMIPKLVNRITQSQQNRVKNAKAINNFPAEFLGANPCIDSILSTRSYPGSQCHFYQCAAHQPASIKCLLQVIEDSSLGNKPKHSFRERKSIFVTSVRISECLSINIYKCLPGHLYNPKSKVCEKNVQNLKKDLCDTLVS